MCLTQDQSRIPYEQMTYSKGFDEEILIKRRFTHVWVRFKEEEKGWESVQGLATAGSCS